MKYNEYDYDGTLQTTDRLFSMEEANLLVDHLNNTDDECSYVIKRAPRVPLSSNSFPFWKAKIMIIDANGNELGYMS